MSKKLSFKSNETYKKTKAAIKAVPEGPYKHNIVALYLKDLAKEQGKAAANQLIDDLKLDYEKAV